MDDLSFLSLSHHYSYQLEMPKNKIFTTHQRTGVCWLRDIELFFNYLNHWLHSKGGAFKSIILTHLFLLLVTRQHTSAWTLSTASRTTHLYDHDKHSCSVPHSLIISDCQPPVFSWFIPASLHFWRNHCSHTWYFKSISIHFRKLPVLSLTPYRQS